jgi:hypothetical protein
VWEDRFQTPTAEELAGELHRQHAPAFAHAREIAGSGGREAVTWQGVWNWTIEFRHNGDAGPALAYLIPDPDRPRVCVPIPEEALAALGKRRLAKHVKDSLAHAPVVQGVRWPVWEIHTKAGVEEILSLMEVRLPARPV